MSTAARVPATEDMSAMMTDRDAREVVRRLLDSWAGAVARHQPERVAELFTPDALFQGFDPTPGHGPRFVAAYYGRQPLGLTARYGLLRVRAIGAGTIIGFAHVEFNRPEGVVPVYLTLVAEQRAGGWRISHYHVSKLTPA